MRLFVWLAASSLIAVTSAQTKNKDEDRPYKFGFNIEGHQHRKEEKDEKGIIRGEYGFITADGYYRVTVYETDEEGRFKIVSQKNYYVGFPPGDPTTTQNPFKSSTTVSKNLSTSKTIVKKLPGTEGASCGSCILPTKPPSTTTTTSFRDSILIKSLLINEPDPPMNVENTLTTTQKSPIQDVGPRLTGKSNGPPLSTPKYEPIQNNGPVQPEDKSTTIKPSIELQTTLKYEPLFQTRQNGNNSPVKPVIKPTITKQQPTPKYEPIFQTRQNGHNPTAKSNAEKPNSSQQSNLLYRFNYTVGFHGHHEDGYRNGDKSGDYFVNGRDGVSQKVEYIANEFGYQPNITLTNLEENDPNRPNEETEKSHGLRGYEFKWFNKR